MSFSVDTVTKELNKKAEAKESEKEDKKRKAREESSQYRANERFNAQKEKEAAKARENMKKNTEAATLKLLETKIKKRFKAFPWLTECVQKPTARPTLGELYQLDELQKMELNMKGAEERIRSYIAQGSQVLESFWGDGSKMTFLPENLRLNLRGLHEIMTSPEMNKEIEPLVIETTIEHPELGEMSLSMRWISAIVGVITAVHVKNTTGIPIDKLLTKFQNTNKNNGKPLDPVPSTTKNENISNFRNDLEKKKPINFCDLTL